MKIVLIHPPHTAIGSRLAGEHLPPLGLLSLSGGRPLLGAEHTVRLMPLLSRFWCPSFPDQ